MPSAVSRCHADFAFNGSIPLRDDDAADSIALRCWRTACRKISQMVRGIYHGDTKKYVTTRLLENAILSPGAFDIFASLSIRQMRKQNYAAEAHYYRIRDFRIRESFELDYLMLLFSSPRLA